MISRYDPKIPHLEHGGYFFRHSYLVRFSAHAYKSMQMKPQLFVVDFRFVPFDDPLVLEFVDSLHCGGGRKIYFFCQLPEGNSSFVLQDGDYFFCRVIEHRKCLPFLWVTM